MPGRVCGVAADRRFEMHHAQQPLRFLGLQVTPHARLQAAQREEAYPHPAELLHEPVKMFEHDADLVLPALGQPHFVPRVIALADELDARGRGPAAV